MNNNPICLGNISKDFSESDTRKNRIVWNCVLFYSPTSVYDAVKIHKYLENQYL